MITIKLADCMFSLDNKYTYTEKLCSAYKVEGSGIFFSLSDSEIDREQTGNYPRGYLESLAFYRKIAEFLIEKDVLLFHGSAIAVDGVGYLFTARSGTGKSTHTRLWSEYFGKRAIMINDDKPLLRIVEQGVTVYGSPWDGKHRLSTNTNVPLKGICILNRGEENHIERVSSSNAFGWLLQQSYRSENEQHMRKILHLIELLSNSVEVYFLNCNMEKDAVKIAYEGINGEKLS